MVWVAQVEFTSFSSFPLLTTSKCSAGLVLDVNGGISAVDDAHKLLHGDLKDTCAQNWSGFT